MIPFLACVANVRTIMKRFPSPCTQRFRIPFQEERGVDVEIMRINEVGAVRRRLRFLFDPFTLRIPPIVGESKAEAEEELEARNTSAPFPRWMRSSGTTSRPRTSTSG